MQPYLYSSAPSQERLIKETGRGICLLQIYTVHDIVVEGNLNWRLLEGVWGTRGLNSCGACLCGVCSLGTNTDTSGGVQRYNHNAMVSSWLSREEINYWFTECPSISVRVLTSGQAWLQLPASATKRRSQTHLRPPCCVYAQSGQFFIPRGK